MTRADLRDMRLRVIAGVPLTESEQLALIEGSERLVDSVFEWAASDGAVSQFNFAEIGKAAINIVREVRLR